jgi:tetrahydromethanopterin S-methyltransferase subunit G
MVADKKEVILEKVDTQRMFNQLAKSREREQAEAEKFHRMAERASFQVGFIIGLVVGLLLGCMIGMYVMAFILEVHIPPFS